MKLKELKQMIAEEYAAYKRSKRGVNENLPGMDDMPMDDPMGSPMADMGGAPGGAPKIDVGPDDIKVGGKEEDPMATLKSIFDMLKDFFEGDDKGGAPKGGPKGGGKKDDKGGDDKKKDDKGGDDKGGDDKGGDKKKEKEDMKEFRRRKLRKGKRVMTENKLQSRFKKLANITK
jgi:hypothetical protein